MKISVNPITKLLAKAEMQINLHYSPKIQDVAHDRKRALALAVLAGNEPSPEFVEAATVEDMTPRALAELIVSKPDMLMARENTRRQVIVRLRAAKTAAELDQILKEEGAWIPVPAHLLR